MTRSPIIVAALKKNNAVEDFRKLIGSTNPEDAEKGTVRKLLQLMVRTLYVVQTPKIMLISSLIFNKNEMY